MKDRLRSIFQWLVGRLKRTHARDRRIEAWVIFIGWVASSVTATVIAIGSPTGAGFRTQVLDISKAIALNSLGYAVLVIVFASLLSLLYVPLPRLAFASFAYVGTLSVCTLYEVKSGLTFSLIIGVGYSLLTVLLGYLFGILVRYQALRLTLYIVAFAGALGGSVYVLSNTANLTAGELFYSDDPQNPGASGDYPISFMTYGSGVDEQREAFGSSVNEVTPTVDASERITRWSESREAFWGFGPEEIPLNGRVWMPEGEGPFPVILMVHGNHTMEYFSTDGYDYLGEHLASRGFLFVSVDEDFINYSNVSGQPNDNFQLRAWLLLQHVLQLKEMNQQSDSLLYKKLDLEQVALAGHSRGGQAAPMAANYEKFFDDETLQKELEAIHIKAVAAIAPTDKMIDSKRAELHNISYMVLQGAEDADISEFRGDRQFNRTTFHAGSSAFKTSIYVEHANHTQFNTSWGRMDLSLPKGLFLNRADLLTAEEQQQIAKVYFSAFFERVFHNDRSYDELFVDAKNGESWLPETSIVHKYQDGMYRLVKQFKKEDEETESLEGFSNAEVITPEDRSGSTHISDALKLEWDERAVFKLELSKKDLENAVANHAENLILTFANVDKETMPDIRVDMVASDDRQLDLVTDERMTLAPVIQTNYTPFGVLDDLFREGKYDTSWEPVFQTVKWKLDHVEQLSEEATIQLRIHFGDGDGKVLLQEIGVS